MYREHSGSLHKYPDIFKTETQKFVKKPFTIYREHSRSLHKYPDIFKTETQKFVKKPFTIYREHSRSLHKYPDIFKTEIFFSVLGFCSHTHGVFSKTVPCVEFSWKRRFIVYASTDENGGCLNTMISYITQHTPCKGCYRISMAWAFSRGGVKTIGIRYVRTHIVSKSEPTFVYKNIRIRVYEA